MTDAMFSPSSSSDHNTASNFSSENPLTLPTNSSTGHDPAEELFALFETHFQAPADNDNNDHDNRELSDLELDAIADALTQDQPATLPILIEPIPLPEKVVPAETDIPWFNLAQKLREQNQTLIQRVVKLEQVLGDTKHQSQVEVRRLRHLTGELEQTHRQLQAIIQQRDSFQQESQQQRLQLETLTEQHDRTQSNLAQLERDCVRLQEDNNSKTHQVLQLSEELTHSQATFAQIERNCAQLQEDNNSKTHEVAQLNSQLLELRSRLNRQQRYTLEYKAALDQALAQNSQPIAPQPTTKTLPTPVIQPWSEGNSEPEQSEALASGALPSLLDQRNGVVAGNVVEPVVEPSLSVEATGLNHATQDNFERDNSENAAIESVSEIEAEIFASIQDHLEQDSLTMAENLAELDLVPEVPEPVVPQPAETEPNPFSSIKSYPVFTRHFSMSPSFAINPNKKPAPPVKTKKVELPAFLSHH